MKLGIVITSTDAETVWNAFRLGLFTLKEGDKVKVFLLAKGVECDSLSEGQFVVAEQMQEFIREGGKIYACGTCLKIRNSEGTEICSLSTMQDLYEIIHQSNRVLTF